VEQLDAYKGTKALHLTDYAAEWLCSQLEALTVYRIIIVFTGQHYKEFY